MRKEQIPMYLAGAAAVATLVSIAAFEILIGMALVAMLVTKTKFRRPPITLPMLVWIGLTVVSLLANGHVRDGLPQIKKYYVYLILFLVASTFRTLGQLRGLTTAWAGVATLSAGWGLIQFSQKHAAATAAHVDFYTFYVGNRITGFMSIWMTFSGQMMIVLLLIGAAVFFQRLWWFLPAGVIVLAALLAADTRSMWLGAGVGGIYLVWCWRRWMILAVPPFLALLLLANPFGVRERAISIFRPHEGNIDSNEHRHVLREVGWNMIKAHPILGLGPDQPGRQILQYLPDDAPRPLPKEWYTGHLHNIYFQYGADRGIPALLALLWMLGRALYDFRGQHGCVAVILAVMVSGWYEVNLGDSEVLGLFMAVLGAGYALLEISPSARRTPAQSLSERAA